MTGILDKLAKKLWAESPETLKGPRGLAIKALRFVHLILSQASDAQLNLRAMSLVYTTILSLVPLLAVSFSVLKAFGVLDRIEPFLFNFLAPLGDKGQEITQRIMEFIANVRVGLLGTAGVAMLIFTVISLIYKIEPSFNAIWHVTTPRNFSRRFSDYMSVILVGPLLIVGALGITASLMSSYFMQSIITLGPLGSIFSFGISLLPYLLVCTAFTFIYMFVPNTRVGFRPALAGGIVGGVLWETAGWTFSSFIAGSTKYAAIYSSFAILIMFMMWLYISWLILLIGVVVTFYWQHPNLVTAQADPLTLSQDHVERCAFMIMYTAASEFYDAGGPVTTRKLEDSLGTSTRLLSMLLKWLTNAGLLVEVETDTTAYLPGRALEKIRLADISDAVRRRGSDTAYESVAPIPARLNDILSSTKDAVDFALGETTLRDILTEETKENNPD